MGAPWTWQRSHPELDKGSKRRYVLDDPKACDISWGYPLKGDGWLSLSDLFFVNGHARTCDTVIFIWHKYSSGIQLKGGSCRPCKVPGDDRGAPDRTSEIRHGKCAKVCKCAHERASAS